MDSAPADLTKSTLNVLSSASSFFNNSDSSEEEEEIPEPVKPIRRRSMLMPPSRREERPPPAENVQMEAVLEENPPPSRDVMEELLEIIATFPIPPTVIENQFSVTPAAPAPETPKTNIRDAVSGGLSAMKSWWGNKKELRTSKG